MRKSRLSAGSLLKMKELKKEGKKYTEIAKIIGCTPQAARYHLNPQVKEESRLRWAERAKINPLRNRLKGFCRRNNNSSKDISNDEFINHFSNQKTCYLTGDKININDVSTYELDHKLPPNKGGTNDINNMGLCTKEANRSKNDLAIKEYIELCKKVLIHNGYSVIDRREGLV